MVHPAKVGSRLLKNRDDYNRKVMSAKPNHHCDAAQAKDLSVMQLLKRSKPRLEGHVLQGIGFS